MLKHKEQQKETQVRLGIGDFKQLRHYQKLQRRTNQNKEQTESKQTTRTELPQIVSSSPKIGKPCSNKGIAHHIEDDGSDSKYASPAISAPEREPHRSRSLSILETDCRRERERDWNEEYLKSEQQSQQEEARPARESGGCLAIPTGARERQSSRRRRRCEQPAKAKAGKSGALGDGRQCKAAHPATRVLSPAPTNRARRLPINRRFPRSAGGEDSMSERASQPDQIRESAEEELDSAWANGTEVGQVGHISLVTRVLSDRGGGAGPATLLRSRSRSVSRLF
ncbi:hypothetical protein NL676_028198 [Syzygium grande]|nr:hypothetical protein NL676_028198 [Syzygium grande]